MINSSFSDLRPVFLWLVGAIALVALMVVVGGATRLTDSGLSITEWDLLMGALPPLSSAAWDEVFEKYKLIPEYSQVNAGMSLAEFKGIYWWEWGHRNLGRFIGLFFLLPLAWWSFRGRITGGLRLRLWGLFVLICLQGAIGWYMVASGLSERVDVSQYRLALHLGTALILFGLMVWQALALWRPQGAQSDAYLFKLGAILLGLSFIQMILGAFVAGLRAGSTFNTWPLMDGKFVPDGYFQTPAHAQDMFETIAAVQFNHRIGALVLAAFAVFFAINAYRRQRRKIGNAVLAVIAAQAFIGIWTLIAAVPLSLGLFHQFGALCVLGVLIWSVYDLSPRVENTLRS